jgi:hypothetical protein
MLACPSALALVTPAGRYSVIYHVPNTIDGLRNHPLRALRAQSFLPLPQLPFTLSRDRQLHELIYDPFFHVGKNAFTVVFGAAEIAIEVRNRRKFLRFPIPRCNPPSPLGLSRAARLYETVYEMISPADIFGGRRNRQLISRPADVFGGR